MRRGVATLLHITSAAVLLAIAPCLATGTGEPVRGDSTAVVASADSAASRADSLDLGSWVDEEEQRRFAKVPWRIGEYFQFSIDWNGLNGGSSLMQVQNLQRVGGRRAYRIVSKTESNSFVSKFYKVRDRAESYIDAESLYSVRFIKHLREGGYKSDVDIRFDQANR